MPGIPVISLPTVFLLISFSSLMAQSQANYDESKVPPLLIPDLLVSLRGKPIQHIEDWEKIRRPELVTLFEKEMYGRIPRDFDAITFEESTETPNPYPDLAVLKEVNIKVVRAGNTHVMRLNVFLPKNAVDPSPVVLLINYKPKDPDGHLVEEDFWPVPTLLSEGYATASFHVETVAPDSKETYTEGILNTLYPELLNRPDGMGALGAWGWAAMRAMDYFVQEPLIDPGKSVLVGHSRAGKAALWASANDSRWTVTIPNESGCGGAALSKRKFGETVEIINTSFPYWFNANFKSYNNKEELLPVDQHMLVGLLAPRAVYFSSAREDQWADPKGEYLSLALGSSIYSEIYGKKISFPKEFEDIPSLIHLPPMGYHIREGQHDLTLEDWTHYLEFLRKLWR